MWHLIEWLPNDSALHRAVDPTGVGVGWNLQTQLLALIAEVSDTTNAILVKVNSGKNAKDPKPLRIPRPGVEDEKPVQLTGDALDTAAMALGGAVVVNRKRKRKPRRPKPERDPNWFGTEKKE